MDAERAPIYPHRLIVVKPLVKRVRKFGSAGGDNKFRKELNGISLHDFKSYGCVVGNQAARKLAAAGSKARCDFGFLSTRYSQTFRRVDAAGKGGYLAAS